MSANASNDMLTFRIFDTGCGIDETMITEIFESFVQEDRKDLKKLSGTGLGTSIAKKLTTLMGGKIWAESPNIYTKDNPGGKGSVFYFTIKATPARKLEEDKFLLEHKALIIDNNHTFRKVFARKLSSFGAETFTAGSKASALKIAQENMPDYVFLDTTMPGDYYVETSEEIKQIKPDCKIFLLYTYNPAGSRFSELSHIYKLVKKPFHNSELKALFTDKPDEDDAKAESRKYDLRVLIAEDNPINQKVISMVFKQFGVEPVIAANGKEAVELASQKVFDIIFLDMLMPVMSGEEAVRMMRKAGVTVPIVAISANIYDNYASRIKELELDGYLTKPVSVNAIKEVLDRFFRG